MKEAAHDAKDHVEHAVGASRTSPTPECRSGKTGTAPDLINEVIHQQFSEPATSLQLDSIPPSLTWFAATAPVNGLTVSRESQ